MLLALRPQGVTIAEAKEIFGSTQGAITGMISDLCDMKGYDIKMIPMRDRSRTDKRDDATGWCGYASAYRLVGKDRPGGGYRSFIRRAD